MDSHIILWKSVTKFTCCERDEVEASNHEFEARVHEAISSAPAAHNGVEDRCWSFGLKMLHFSSNFRYTSYAKVMSAFYLKLELNF